MNAPDSPDQPRSTRRSVAANDRLKERWGRRLAWSFILAVLIHGAVFLLSPEWDYFDRSEVDRLGGASREVAVTPVPPPRGPAEPAGALPSGQRPDSTAEQENAGAAGDSETSGTNGSGETTAYTQDELWKRLDGAEGPELALTDPSEPSPQRTTSSPSPDDSIRSGGSGRSHSIGGRVATIAVARDRPQDSTRLGRLNSLRPEIVSGLGSSEVLLRNPSEVVRFKEGAARRRPAVAEADAVVGVAVWVDKDGSVEWAEVSESTGNQVLDKTALTLFRDVVAFRPAVEDGKRVPKSMLFYVLFPW